MTVIQDEAGNYLSRSETGDWVPAKMSLNPTTGTMHVYDGGDWHPLPGEAPSAVGAFGRGMIRGGTFGFGDEIEAAIRAAGVGVPGVIPRPDGSTPAGSAYDKALAVARERNEMDMKEHPYANIAGMVAGGVGTALATRGAGPRIAAATGVNPAAGMVAANPLVRLGVGGAAAGGVAGFGEGEGLLDRLGGANTGAMLGAAVGPIAGLGVNMVNRLGGRLFRAFGGGDSNAQAERQVARALDRDNVSIDEAERRSTAAGNQPVAPVDLGGRNTVNLGATAANTPGEAMQVADQFVEGRRLGRPDRLMTASDTAFGGGSGTDVADTTAALRGQRTTEATPLYREAFGRPAGMTDAMGHIIDDPIGQTGLRRGLEIQRIENAARRARGEPEVPTNDPAIHFDDDGTPRIVGVPNMRSLDAIKRGMDSMIDAARSDTTGQVQWTERLRAIDDMRRTWVRLLDQNNPAYAEARAAWGGPSAQMEATQAGRTAMRTDRDIVAQRATTGPEDVRDAYRLGAGRDVSDRFSDPARASGAARLMLEDTNMQHRLASLLKPEELAAFNAVLQRETQMTAVERAVGPRAGSQTGRLLAGGADMEAGVPGPVMQGISQVLGGHPLQGGLTIGRDLVVRRLGQGINPATSDALANRLFQTDPAERAALYQSLRNRLLTDKAAAEKVRRFVSPVIQGISEQAGAASSRD